MAHIPQTWRHLHRKSQVASKETTVSTAPCHTTVTHSEEATTSSDDTRSPFCSTVSVGKRATKPQLTNLTAEEILHIVFTYKMSTSSLYSPESGDYRQTFFSFLVLVFLGVWNFQPNPSKVKNAHRVMPDKLVCERPGTELPPAIASYHSESHHNPPDTALPESNTCSFLFKGYTGALTYFSFVFTPTPLLLL